MHGFDVVKRWFELVIYCFIFVVAGARTYWKFRYDAYKVENLFFHINWKSLLQIWTYAFDQISYEKLCILILVVLEKVLIFDRNETKNFDLVYSYIFELMLDLFFAVLRDIPDQSRHVCELLDDVDKDGVHGCLMCWNLSDQELS